MAQSNPQGIFSVLALLTPANISKYLSKTVASVKVHLDQEQQGKCSTAQQTHTILADPEQVDHEQLDQKTMAVYVVIVKADPPSGRMNSNLTGHFPFQSSRGNKYIFVLHDYDSNAIFMEPLCNPTDREILKAYMSLHHYLAKHGLKPKLHHLDNEASTILKTF